MKKAFAIMAIVLLPDMAAGQVGTELFQQGQAQTRYLMQQIAALKVYIGYAQKGYDIAKGGLDDIGKIKKGDLGLHAEYFGSLKSVNPNVSKYSKVAGIVKIQMDILNIYGDARKAMAGSGLLTAAESAYAEGVYSNLLEDCVATMDELTAVTTSGQLQMTDDERIRRIDLIYADMQSMYRFVKEFSTQAKLLGAARKQDLNEVKDSRNINGIK